MKQKIRTIVHIMLMLFTAGCSGTQEPPTSTHAPSPTSIPPTHTTTSELMNTPETIPESPCPLLMAHYMPWYQTPSVSGYWGWHWTMNHFNPEQHDENGRPVIASYTMPLTGPYDSSDDDLLEYQVLLMKLSGIDGVIVDWYGMEEFRDYGVLNQSTNKLFTHIKEAGLSFAICYEDQAIKHMVDNKYLPAKDVYTHGQAVMRYLQDTWFHDEAYLKVAGQPLLLTFGPQYYTNATHWDTLFSVLDTRPAFITLDSHTESAGLSSYPWPPMWAGQDGVLSQEALEQYLTTFYKKAARWGYLVAGAFPGFRDIYQEVGVASEVRYLDVRQGETFRFTLQMALDQRPNVIQLITWNDYGESTSIEPTEEFGYQYLEVVQETRRTMEGGDFSFTADDLRLPLQLFKVRKHYAEDTGVQARLDEVFAAILTGEVDTARRIIANYSIEP